MVFAQQADHLLLTRIVTQPDKAELFSIYNPTNTSIDLSNYYVCDDEDYYKMQTEGDMSPAKIGSGFAAQFPEINIEPADTLTIVLHEQYKDHYGDDFDADLVMFGESDNSLIGYIGGATGKINEVAEMIILFKWNGDV
ncbi:uncharacterized protein METZ01_LOCUS468086, partial [marine metagenome]